MRFHGELGTHQNFGAGNQFGLELDSADAMAAPNPQEALKTRDFIVGGILNDEHAAEMVDIFNRALFDPELKASVILGCQSAIDQSDYRDSAEASERLAAVYGQMVPKTEKSSKLVAYEASKSSDDVEAVLSKEWQDFSNCLGVDPDMFFPERGASTREAKEVCRGCVVREECLEYALIMGEKFGIWGGMSERERRRIRRQRALARVAAQATD